MANSLLELVPHQVSKDLSGYSIFIYGSPKVGKTTLASKFPNPLILAFEKGYSALPNIFAKDINTWGEFKKTLKELKDPLVKEKFKTIVIDTADLAYDACVKYVCSRESTDKATYEKIGDIPYGQGWGLCEKEFDNGIRQIIQLGYTLIIISHERTKTEKNEVGVEVERITPTLDNTAKKVCLRACDIITYARLVQTPDGVQRRLFFREDPRFLAGSRFKDICPSVELGYQNLVDAIVDAIASEAEETDNMYVTEEREQVVQEQTYDFEGMKKEFQDLVGALINTNPNNQMIIVRIIDKYLGKGKKVGDCTEDQVEQLDLILNELRELK